MLIHLIVYSCFEGFPTYSAEAALAMGVVCCKTVIADDSRNTTDGDAICVCEVGCPDPLAKQGGASKVVSVAQLPVIADAKPGSKMDEDWHNIDFQEGLQGVALPCVPVAEKLGIIEPTFEGNCTAEDPPPLYSSPMDGDCQLAVASSVAGQLAGA